MENALSNDLVHGIRRVLKKKLDSRFDSTELIENGVWSVLHLKTHAYTCIVK